jgi:hypothetical protein
LVLKTWISILLLSLYLVSATEFYQLLKLPLLVEHYIEHKREKSDLSVWEFLRIHYASGIDYDKDYEKDMKLPFKTHNDCADQLVAFSTPPTALLHPLTRYYFPVIHGITVSEVDFLCAAYLSSIWQPPRFC